jgi:hypothetical protein
MSAPNRVPASLLELERRFWLEGAEFYRQHLGADFVMLFPGVGIMSRAQAIDGIERGQRWRHVETRDEHVLALGPDTRLLYYAANARREGADEYSALVSSVYIRRDDGWQLVFHQQSPIR